MHLSFNFTLIFFSFALVIVSFRCFGSAEDERVLFSICKYQGAMSSASDKDSMLATATRRGSGTVCSGN